MFKQTDCPVSFVKPLQRSPTGQLIPLDGSVNLCEKIVVRWKELAMATRNNGCSMYYELSNKSL